MFGLSYLKLAALGVIALGAAFLLGWGKVGWSKYETAQARVNALETELAGAKAEVTAKATAAGAIREQADKAGYLAREYKGRLDEAERLLRDARCVKPEEKDGILDGETNAKLADLLNSLGQ